MMEGSSRNCREVRLLWCAVDDDATAFDLDLNRAGPDADVVFHGAAASRTATVTTCAVCGDRSNAFTDRRR
jgi:hypothetical protein